MEKEKIMDVEFMPTQIADIILNLLPISHH